MFIGLTVLICYVVNVKQSGPYKRVDMTRTPQMFSKNSLNMRLYVRKTLEINGDYVKTGVSLITYFLLLLLFLQLPLRE
jgi:hypothetical protein